MYVQRLCLAVVRLAWGLHVCPVCVGRAVQPFDTGTEMSSSYKIHSTAL